MTPGSLEDFFAMGGHWLEVWSSWAFGAAIVAMTLLRPLRARRRFFAEEKRRIAREANRSEDGNGNASTTP